jgi:hypothetical protein
MQIRGDVCERSRKIRQVAAARVDLEEGVTGNINDHIALWAQMLQDPLRRGGFARTLVAFYVHMRDRHGAQSVAEAYQILEQGMVTNVGFLREMANSGVLSDTHRITEAIRAGGYNLH